MIKQSGFFSFLFFFFGTAMAQPDYTIEGHIGGLEDGTKVYLIDAGQRKTIDSTIVKNESFFLKGRLNEPALMYLHAGKTIKLADILLDNRPVTVKGTKPVYDSVRIGGLEIDRQWKEWYACDQEISYLAFRLKKQRQTLLNEQDTITGTQLKLAIDGLTNARILLLKQSVKNTAMHLQAHCFPRFVQCRKN